MIPTHAADADDLVEHASPVASTRSLRKVTARIRQWDRWLNVDHPYNGDVIAALKCDDVNGPKLGEYIAASATLHLADGWNYLSSAFESASRGNRSAAIHLSYYAELRAAMSLLATEGVGIFNQRHIALDDLLVPMQYRRNTHRATWEIFSAWSRRRIRAESLLDTISIESRTLTEWLQEIRVTRFPIVEAWLKSWSLDLETLADDSSRRNEISYRPSRIRVPFSPPVNAEEELVAPLFNTWFALEPSAGSPPGAALDSSLLREAIDYAVRMGLCPHRSLDDAVDSFRGVASESLISTLRRGNANSILIFAEARRKEKRPSTATPMLARAFLLLRLASASTASMLRETAVTKEDLEFWWGAYARDIGLWSDVPNVDSFSELWLDVSDAIDEAEDRVSALLGSTSVHGVSQILLENPPLTQFSRAPLWLLDLD